MTQDTRDRRENELKKHFTDDGYFQYLPNKWVGWNKITKELLIVESKKNQYSELPQTLYYKNDGLRNHLKRYQGASYGDIDSSFISIDDEVLPIKDFINKACLTPYTRPFLYRALSIIPYEPGNIIFPSSTNRW